MTLRVCIRPAPEKMAPNHGIGRVIYAQARHLPEFDVQLVEPERADLFIGHTDLYDMPRLDVFGCHGFYWTGEPGSGLYGDWHNKANRHVIDSARKARAITVPSDWVANIFRRDMRIEPEIVPHGIEPEEWEPGTNGGYILWNKNRPSDVCDPTPPWALALKELPVVTTFAPEDKGRPAALKILGQLPAAEMRTWIQNADVYLATVKETFGIGTLEAMACGVPVLGYRHGGTADLVRHQVEGYLAAPGDLEDLLAGYGWIQRHRAELSAYARTRAAQFTWRKAIEQYAALYQRVYQEMQTEPTGVAVVITNYNYGQWVCEAVDSVLRQSYPVDEVIVVDDGSTDDSRAQLDRYARHPRVRLISQENEGVAAARNHGVASSRQPFVVCLDADDKLDPLYVETCRRALQENRDAGIAFTNMHIMNPEGEIVQRNVWTGPFNWEWQAEAHVPPHTTIHTAAMFRRSLWERCGGYKQKYAPGEDAEFYTHGLSLGFTGIKASEDGLLHYRNHGAGAHKTKHYVPIDDNKPWMRDRDYPAFAPTELPVKVRSYSDPLVSVITPVGPGHADFLAGAVHSMVGQTFRNWELVVVDDGADIPQDLYRLYPFVRRVKTSGGLGPGAARNAGLDAATGTLVTFLDADDRLAPTALESMLHAYAGAEGHYIYTDWLALDERGDLAEQKVQEYDVGKWFEGTLHAVTALLPLADARRVRFDETLAAWEDWEFYLHAAILGIHGKRLAQPLLLCNVGTQFRTRSAWEQHADLRASIPARYRAYQKGEKAIMGCCGGSAGAAVLAVKRAFDSERQAPPPGPDPATLPAAPGMVRMEFVGSRVGAVTYYGVDGANRQYRGGRNAVDRFADVDPRDVKRMQGTGEWKIVPPPPPKPVEDKPVEAPKPVPPPAPTPARVEAPKPTPPPVPVEPEPVPAEQPAPEPVPEPAPVETPKRKRGRPPKTPTVRVDYVEMGA